MQDKIDFSVVVPVFEQWDLIPTFLEAMRAQSIDSGRYEIILVDNGAFTHVAPDCQGLNVQITKCSQPGSYAARNVGAKMAKGSWLVFSDSDCIPSPDWLASIESYLNDIYHVPMILAGQVNIAVSSDSNWYEIYDVVKGINQSLYVSKGYAATANLAVKKSLFDQLGGFSEVIFSGGDVDFCERAVHRGVKLKYLESAIVNHPTRKTWHELKTKARRVVGGRLLKPNKNKFSTLLRIYTPPLRAIKLFLSKPNTPFLYKGIAIIVQARLWLTEMLEATLVVAGKLPERR